MGSTALQSAGRGFDSCNRINKIRHLCASLEQASGCKVESASPAAAAANLSSPLYVGHL